MTEIDEDKGTGDAAKETRPGDQKPRDKKTKKKFATKVIIRRLPPSMTEDVFVQQIEPMPDHDYFYFVPADWSLGQFATSRAYINFADADDVFLFKDKFDGYVFVDTKGVEYPAIVEFAPLQSLPKNKSRKTDNKSGTIADDPLYQSFLAALTSEETDPAKPEMKMEYSYQIKDDKKVTSTPLLEFLAHKKEERREERRKRVEDKKKVREEEKIRKKELATKGEVDDKKRKEFGKYRNKKDVNKSIPSIIPEEEDDGIIVRTVKSRILDNAENRWKSGKERDADRADRAAGNEGDAAAKNQKDRRKERRRNYREAKRAAETESEFRILKPEKPEKPDNKSDKPEVPEGPAAVAPAEPAAFKRPFDKPKEEKVKKYSESRRERRASMRNQAAATDSPDTGKSDEPKGQSSKRDQPKDSGFGRDKKPKAFESDRKYPEIDDDRRSSVESNVEENRPESASTKAERDLARIRKKDRPSLQIYQPGRRRTSNGDNQTEKSASGRSSPTEKTRPVSDPAPADAEPTDGAKPKSEKRVSRYSERRNKNKEIQRKQPTGDELAGDLSKMSLTREDTSLGDEAFN